MIHSFLITIKLVASEMCILKSLLLLHLRKQNYSCLYKITLTVKVLITCKNYRRNVAHIKISFLFYCYEKIF